MAKPTRWYDDPEKAIDKAGNYFLLTEMVRGMWVVLEQFFRAPYVAPVHLFANASSILVINVNYLRQHHLLPR